MKRFLNALLLMLGCAGAALADSISDQVVANLKAQGYTVLEMDRTWLGRMWILAENGTVQREVVFNPGTGEILRDYAVLISTLPADEAAKTRTAVAEREHDGKEQNAASAGVAAATSRATGDGDAGALTVPGDAETSTDAPTTVTVAPIDPVE